ncbi:MAG: PA14 domain-containing protein, partial [Verrucomicrobiota bacterium]|nr:PA14 domain-containing protein [Verrucomicrobiota bacterium]
MRTLGSSDNRRDCEIHLKPPALLLGALGLILLVPLVVDAANERGLILRLDSPDGSSDARAVRSVALHVPSGQSPSPFLKPGSFTARWEGKLVLEKRSRLVFHLEGTGQARLFIDGEALVESIGTPSESERLRSGEHELLVEYSPPPEGETTLRLSWEGRDFGKEPMPGNVFRHDPEDGPLQRQSSFRRGRMLVAETRCGSCHDPGTEGTM